MEIKRPISISKNPGLEEANKNDKRSKSFSGPVEGKSYFTKSSEGAVEVEGSRSKRFSCLESNLKGKVEANSASLDREVKLVRKVNTSLVEQSQGKKSFFGKLCDGIKSVAKFVGKCFIAPFVVASLLVPGVGSSILYRDMTKQIKANEDPSSSQGGNMFARDAGAFFLFIIPPLNLLYIPRVVGNIFNGENPYRTED